VRPTAAGRRRATWAVGTVTVAVSAGALGATATLAAALSGQPPTHPVGQPLAVPTRTPLPPAGRSSRATRLPPPALPPTTTPPPRTTPPPARPAPTAGVPRTTPPRTTVPPRTTTPPAPPQTPPMTPPPPPPTPTYSGGS
jgi:hypothetical protein